MFVFWNFLTSCLVSRRYSSNISNESNDDIANWGRSKLEAALREYGIQWKKIYLQKYCVDNNLRWLKNAKNETLAVIILKHKQENGELDLDAKNRSLKNLLDFCIKAKTVSSERIFNISRIKEVQMFLSELKKFKLLNWRFNKIKWTGIGMDEMDFCFYYARVIDVIKIGKVARKRSLAKWNTHKRSGMEWRMKNHRETYGFIELVNIVVFKDKETANNFENNMKAALASYNIAKTPVSNNKNNVEQYEHPNGTDAMIEVINELAASQIEQLNKKAGEQVAYFCDPSVVENYNNRTTTQFVER